MIDWGLTCPEDWWLGFGIGVLVTNFVIEVYRTARYIIRERIDREAT